MTQTRVNQFIVLLCGIFLKKTELCIRKADWVFIVVQSILFIEGSICSRLVLIDSQVILFSLIALGSAFINSISTIIFISIITKGDHNIVGS